LGKPAYIILARSIRKNNPLIRTFGTEKYWVLLILLLVNEEYSISVSIMRVFCNSVRIEMWSLG